MKCVTISNEYLADLNMNLSAFKTDTNKIRFQIGLGSNESGLACKAIIVNNGQMAHIGFETSLPKEGFDSTGNEMYMDFILSASDFCNYASVLCSYKSDVDISYDGTTVSLSIGEDVDIPLSTISEENAEPMLACDVENSILKMYVDGEKILDALKTGAYVAENEVDSRGISDRAAFVVANNECKIYSTNGHLLSKSVCSAEVVFNELFHAKCFLKEKGAALDEKKQNELFEQMKKCQNDEAGMVAVAKPFGFVEYTGHEFGLSASAVNVIQKVYAGYKQLVFIVTHNNLHIMSGNVYSTFALAGKIASIYKNTVEGEWSSLEWDAQAVVDKEVFCRALSVHKLGADNIPFNISATDSEIVTVKSGNKISIPIISKSGNIENVDVNMSVKYFIQILSRLSNGNISLRCMTGDKGDDYPMMISNGGLNDTPDTLAYVIGVRTPATTNKPDKQK